MKPVKVAADNRAIKRDDKICLNPRNSINVGKEFISSCLLLDTKLLPKKRETSTRKERKARLKDDILFFPTQQITNDIICVKPSIY